jgi:class 3 adenylate cyclase
MANERVERRLAAILAADVAGYSRLMGIDEEETLAGLKGLRKSLIDPKIADHRGRIVKTTGDGALLAGRYEESSSWAERALQRRPNLLVAIRESAASNALAGRLLKAQKAMAQLRQFDPELSISNFTDWLPLRQP